MVQGTNKTGEVSAYTFNGLGVRVGTELILEDNSHGYTDFHCQTPSVETGIEKPEVVKTDYVIDYTRLNIDQRVLMKSEQDGYDFFYTYGLDKLQVMTIGEGSNWWGQSVKKCVNMAYVHTDRLGSVVNLSDQYGRVTARADYTDWGEVRRYTDITVDGGFRRLLPEITYATHEYDDVLNQFYAKARMYDAENKRFDAVDPILDPAEYSISNYVSDPMMLVQYLYVVDNPICSTDPLGLLGESVSNWVQEKLYDAAEYLRQKVGDVTKHFTNPVRKSDLEMGIVASLLISAGDTSAMMLQALINTGRYMTGQLPSMEYFNSYLRTKSQINQYFLNRVSYTDSYYLGKSIGDIIGTAVGLGMTAKGISELLAGIGGIGSGVGAVALPICVAISAEGVVTAGAGVTVAAAAAGNFGGDFEKFQCEKKKYSRGDPKAKANWNKESTRCTSKTLYNKKGVRIDVENPNPTVRPGQVHVQTGNKKYIFDNVTKRFYDASNFDIAPKNIQNLLNDAEFVKKLNVGLEQYLGLQGVH